MGGDSSEGHEISGSDTASFVSNETAREALSEFFGSHQVRRILAPGRRRDAFRSQQRAILHPPGRPAPRRKMAKGVAKSGIQRVHAIPHAEAITVLRQGMLSPPELKTDAIMTEYRKLKNKLKRARRMIRDGGLG